MKRVLKRTFNRFLPDALRDLIKRSLTAKSAPSVDINLVVEEVEPALRCTVDQSWSFLAPSVCRTSLANFTDSSEGRVEVQNIARAARRGGILFDVGAHSGLVSAMFCAANSNNRAFSFEPSPILAKRILSVRELNRFGDRMSIEQVGIGETSDTLEMMLDPAGGFIQPLHFDHTMWAAPQKISVQMESIPDAALRLGVTPQFIKIDIEGYEFEAIKGATDFLARYKPEVFLEVHLNYLEERNRSAKALTGMLRQCGYNLYSLSGVPLKERDVYDSLLPIVHVVAR